MSFYNNTKAIGKALISLYKQKEGLFHNNQLRINSNRTILIDADDPNSNIQLNSEGICFNYDKQMTLSTGDVVTAHVCRPLKGAAYTKNELFKYDKESSNPSRKIDRKQVIVTARALTEMFSHGSGDKKQYIKQIANSLNVETDEEITENNMLPTVKAVKTEFGLTYEDVANVAFLHNTDGTTLTLTWKDNSNDLFDKITFTQIDKSNLKKVATKVLDNSNKTHLFNLEVDKKYIIIGYLQLGDTVVHQINCLL